MDILIHILKMILVLMIATSVHELGHCLMAIFCGVKVKALGIGFGRPYLKLKLFGIEFRLSPWLLGGFTKLKGEKTKESAGLLVQSYFKKVLIALAGVFMNLMLILLCYQINYGSIQVGLWYDIHLIYAIFTKTFTILYEIPFNIPVMKINFLCYLSLINLICLIFNLIPFPPLDGSWLWMFSLERFFKKFKNYIKFITWIERIGFSILMVFQVWLVYYWWFVK